MVPDGVFLRDSEGAVSFHEGPAPSRDDVAAGAAQLARRPVVAAAMADGLELGQVRARSDRRDRGRSKPVQGSKRAEACLHARVCVRSSPRVEIDVVTTHLQAGYDAKARAVRERQIRELRDLVDRLGSSARAFVVCGDLDICGLAPSRERGEYASLVAAFDGFRDLGADDDHATFDPRPEANTLAHRFEKGGPRQRIDYVLFRPPCTGRVSAERCELVLDGPITADGAAPTYPSDHFGVRVTIGGLGAEQAERAGEGAPALPARAAMAGAVAEPPSGMGEGAGAR